jgi:DNA/RNA endonuclease G (NUC1)
VLAAATLSCTDATAPTPFNAPLRRSNNTLAAPQVVISQVYGGGGNSGATYTNDFVELFNPGTSPVTLDGWSVQYASASGSSWHVTALSGSIQPGGYYLVQEAQGSGGTTGLPTPDATGTTAMAATAGKVALMNTTTAIASGLTCPGSGSVDEVSFGNSATDCGGGHAPAPSNTNAALRDGGGCTISGSLAADFATGAPNPRNHTTPANVCIGVVISQVYGGGGNSGATYKNDFIEIFNPTGADVSLDGWSVQYASGTGTTWKVTPLAGSVASHHYYLVQEDAGSGGTADLPTPDATGTIALSASAGKIALVRDTAALTGTGAGTGTLGGTPCPTAPAAGIADFVGYGSATCFEGSDGAPSPSATKAVVRRADGNQDTNDNVSDFDAATAAPRNSVYVPPTPGALDHVFISGGSRVVVGTTLSLGATAEDANDVRIPATFTWSTSDPSLATVDQTGHVTAVNPGALVTITATATVNGITKSGNRIIAVSSSTAVSISGRTTPLPVGFEDAMFVSGATAPITWISSDPGVLTVDSVGIITATGVGTATIAAFDANESGAAWFVNTEAQSFSSTARSGHNTELGTPTDGDPSNDVMITRKEYTISYNPQRAGPNWVSWDLSATHLGASDRCNCFTADTALTRQGVKAYTTLDFISGGQYDRGHMEPSADQSTTDTENATTFFLSNVLPQRHDLNAGPWEKLEIALRDSVRAGREAYVIAGGIFTGGTGLGTLNGAGNIFIPDSTWKIVVLMPAGEGLSDINSASDVDVIAVNMPTVTGIILNDWPQYVTTVDKIQQSTGYDFLSSLPESIQCQVEGRSCTP